MKTNPLLATSLIIVAAGAGPTVSPLANTLGFVPLPPLYWFYLATMISAHSRLMCGVANGYGVLAPLFQEAKRARVFAA